MARRTRTRPFLTAGCVRMRASVGTIAVALVLGSAAAPAALGVTQARLSAAETAAASICAKVSAASVSALVGYKVPAATYATGTVKASTLNEETSGVVTTCTFGTETTLAKLLKAVTLEVEVNSKPISASKAAKNLMKLATKTTKITVRAYKGLGINGLYFTVSSDGVTGREVTGLVGKRSFAASVERPLSLAKLAALARLAKRLI